MEMAQKRTKTRRETISVVLFFWGFFVGKVELRVKSYLRLQRSQTDMRLSEESLPLMRHKHTQPGKRQQGKEIREAAGIETKDERSGKKAKRALG